MLKFLSVSKERSKDNHIKWICQCDCGDIAEYLATRVRNNYVNYCEKCRHKKVGLINTKHGMKGTGTYSSWTAMKDRCLNKNSKDYLSYGAKGITISKDWIDSFEKFYLDMGERPKGTSIDRINNDLGYFKENCKWSTRSEQQKNKSNSCYWLVKGEIYETLDEAAKVHKVKKQTIKRWVDGWTDKRINKFWKAKDGCGRIKKY